MRDCTSSSYGRSILAILSQSLSILPMTKILSISSFNGVSSYLFEEQTHSLSLADECILVFRLA